MVKIDVIGYLGKDAQILDRKKDEKYVLAFSLAQTENWKNEKGEEQSKTNWFNCYKTFTKEPKVLEYLKKGTQLFISGKPSFGIRNADGKGIFLDNSINVNILQLLGKKDD